MNANASPSSGAPAKSPDSLEVVLLSGGIDSACLLADRVAQGGEPHALFINYGQPAADAERVASQALADTTAVGWNEVGLAGIVPDSGEIAGRNALLAHLALTWLGRCDAALILIGIHAGSPYRDCSSAFVEETQRSLDFQSGGAVRLLAPFVEWPKALVVSRAMTLGVELNLSYSCERSNDPCGACASCVDRKELLASP